MYFSQERQWRGVVKFNVKGISVCRHLMCLHCCFSFNRDAAADSSSLTLRQKWDSLRSTICVLHSCLARAFLPIAITTFTWHNNATPAAADSCFLSSSWTEGCEKLVDWDQSYGQRGEWKRRTKYPHPTATTVPTPAGCYAQLEEERQRNNSGSLNTRRPVCHKK